MTIRVRGASPADHDAVVALVPRLRAFGAAPLRPPEALDRAERELLERALQAPEADAMLLVADLSEVGPIGIAYMQSATDYFTGERHGHLAILAVAADGEGKGVGRLLLAAAERWAQQRSYRFLSLNVFAANARARAVYERAGFAVDTLRYFKELRPSASNPAG